MNIRAALSFTLAAWLALTPIGAVDIYVDGTNGSDTTGTGAAGNPVRSITTALTLASTPGDRILVLPGTYEECFDTGFNEVEILSTAFDASGTISSTILDGGGTLACGADDPVAILDGGSTLEGFTVRNGQNTGVVAFGGAVITNNVITANSGTYGGGLYAFGAATVTNNVISANSAAYGGGMYLYATDLYGDTDGMQIADNDIRDNEATLDGGGGYVFSFPQNGVGPTVTISTNDIVDNTADGFGGGIAVFTYSYADTTAGVRVTGNLIEGNDVTGTPGGGAYIGYGGGIWAGTNGEGAEAIRIDNNIIRANTTTVAGGGASTWVRVPVEGAAPTHEILLENNDVTTNTSGRDGGGFDLYLEALTLQPGVGSMALRSQDNLVAGNDAATSGGIGGGVVALMVSERTGASGELTFSFERDEISGNTAGSGGGAAVLTIANADPPPLDPNGSRVPFPSSARIDMANTLVVDNAAADSSGNGAGGGILTYLDANGDADAEAEFDLVTVGGNTAVTGGAIEIETLTTTDDTDGVEGRAVLFLRNSIIGSNESFGVGGPIPGTPGYTNPGVGGTGNLEFTLAYSNVSDNASGAIESSVTPDSSVGNQIGIDALLDADFVPGRCSPTIDAGDPSTEFANEPADNGGRVNMGDLGGTAFAVRTLSDVNGDGLVDGLDVIRITSRFGASSPGASYLPAADFDDNLLIDGDDLALVGADFGVECP